MRTSEEDAVRRAGIVLLAVLAGAACETTTGPDGADDAPIRTDRASYALARDTLVILGDSFPHLSTRIEYRFTNRTGRTAYIVNCHGPAVVVEREAADGSWAPFWGTGSEACLSPAIVVEEGERFEGAFEFGGVEFGVEGFSPSFPVPTASLDGTYRMALPDVIHLDDPADYPDGTPVDPAHVRSNRFTVVVR